MIRCIAFIFSFLLLFLASCKQKKNDAYLFSLLENTGISFANNIQNTKDFNIFSYRNFYNGGGVAIGDINNDGLADVFFTANMSSNKLYLNKGNMQFDDISSTAGFSDKKDWSTGVIMVDINHDGWLDIYVCNAGYSDGILPQNKLFINNHALGFTDETKKYGLENKGGYCTHAVFFDYDVDGDLDCYILNNSFIPVNTLNYANKRELRAADWPVADFLKGGGDKLLRNDNDFFVDVSEQAGIYGSLIGFGLGVNVGDINGDHYPDLYISNDFFERDYLYINQKNGTFSESLENCMSHTSLASMGADIGDINNDGYPDIFTTDMLPDDDYRLRTTSSFDNYDVYALKEHSGFYHQYMQNCLQLNDQNGHFKEIANFSGVNASDWSWGALFFDADNDGYNDIYVCNGINNDVTDQDFINFFANEVNQRMVLSGQKEEVNKITDKMPSVKIKNKAFRNKGNLQFSDEGDHWGFTQPSFSNGAAYGDLDNDGDLDLVVNNVNERAFVYQNNSKAYTKTHQVQFALKGVAKNTFAIGTAVQVFAGAQVFSRELHPGRGFQSSVDYKLTIGLGNTSSLDSVKVFWPNLATTTLIHPAVDSLFKLSMPANALPLKLSIDSTVTKLFAAIPAIFDKHEEDKYVDFYTERLVPEMESRRGPAVAVADVNNDGWDDVFIGGAADQEAQLYLQSATGFVKKGQPDFAIHAEFEDVTALFFDADGDKDPDLFVGSGGNTTPTHSRNYINRLYMNNGNGNFSQSTTSLPEMGANVGAVAANDIDNDGDLDLFIGCSSEPLNYGVSPMSCILENKGNAVFRDVTKLKYPALLQPGMISTALWEDVNGDEIKELILAGKWMSPKIFSFANGKAALLNAGLDLYKGYWQTVAVTDMDYDGDADILLGNLGLNFYLRPDSAHPVKIWMHDFDNNGTTDKIITRTWKGKDMPVFMKRELEEQIPSLKKQNLQFADFAGKSIQDIFGNDQLKKAVVKSFNFAAHCIAVNDGRGNFRIRELPTGVQFSTINTFAVADIDSDGKKDIISGGNNVDFLPQFGRLDASWSDILINKGDNNFNILSTAITGLKVKGVIRAIRVLKSGNENTLLIVRNDDLPLLYKMPVKK